MEFVGISSRLLPRISSLSLSPLPMLPLMPEDKEGLWEAREDLRQMSPKFYNRVKQL